MWFVNIHAKSICVYLLKLVDAVFWNHFSTETITMLTIHTRPTTNNKYQTKHYRIEAQQF